MIDRSKRICSPKRSIRSQGSLHGFPAHQTQKTVLPPDHDPLSNKTSLEAWIQKHGTAVLLLTSSNVSQIKKSFWRVFKYFIFLLKTPAVSPWKRNFTCRLTENPKEKPLLNKSLIQQNPRSILEGWVTKQPTMSVFIVRKFRNHLTDRVKIGALTIEERFWVLC